MRATGALALLAVALHAMPARGSLDPGNDACACLLVGGYVRTLAGLQQLRY
jgi:hypothetical protein